MKVPSTGTGVMVTVEEERGVRTLYLDGHCQSDVLVLADGSLSAAQPLELVRIMSLLSTAWLSGGTAFDPDSPRVLLLGLGGGSIARVLTAALPPAGRVHSLELEPEVITAAATYFGLELNEPRCTAEAGDCAEFLKERHRRVCKAETTSGGGGETVGGGASTDVDEDYRYDVILLDAFTADGLAPSTRKNATLDAARGCLTPGGILMVNLHTGPPRDPSDPDYYIARGVLRLLCQRFEAVYSVHCSTTQNLIAVCHEGEMVEADEWETRLSTQLQRPAMDRACEAMDLGAMLEKFEYVGGRLEPLSEDDGDDVPAEFRSR